MRKKIILSFLATILLTISLFFLAFAIGTHYELYHGREEKVTAQANAVFINNKFPVDTFINHKVSEYSNEIILAYKQKNVDLSIYNRSGKMVQSSNGLGKEDTDKIAKHMQKTAKQTLTRIQKRGSENWMTIYWKLNYKGQLIAILKFETSLKKADAVFHELMQKALLIGGVVFCLAILFASILAEKIVKPFEKIIFFIKEMSAGEYKKKLIGDYKDEAGKIVETLNLMGDEIQRRNRERYDFISSISHELKTPLTAINGWTETLQEQSDLTDEEKQLGIITIRQETQRLTQMVDNLLYFSKKEAERSRIFVEQIAVNEYMQDILSLMKIRTAQKEINLRYKISVVYMYADAGKMKQVFLNLIENAIKFSPAKTDIIISILEENSCLKIEIMDQGIGIEKEELKKITEEFYQVHSNVQGEGLGLAVCSNIIALHGGTLWIESELQKGTCIHIQIPQKQNS